MQALGDWRFGVWEDIFEELCSIMEVTLEVP